MNLSTAHLPGTARELVELIGLPATLRLVEAWGGRCVQVAKGARPRGRRQRQDLAETIGKAAADRLAARYAGDILRIPNCKRALLAVRDAELQARFDALTAAGRSARAAVTLMTGEFRLVESSIWRALKRDAAPAAVDVQAALREQAQPSLF